MMLCLNVLLGWSVTLIMLTAIPLLVGAGVVMSMSVSSSSTRGQSAYGRAGHIAEEVFSSIKTVASFGGESREIARYDQALNDAMIAGIRRSLIAGIGLGVMVFTIPSAYGIAFWFGITQMIAGNVTGQRVLNVILAVVMGTQSFGLAAPSFAAVASAQGAAVNIFDIIKANTTSRHVLSNVQQLEQVHGKVEFRNVTFYYPTRPNINVLSDFSLSIHPGETVALVGASGCGKSTTVALVERFYDSTAGAIYVDGQDIKSLDVQHLRNFIGFVAQEPVLFSASIYQNVAWGSVNEKQATIEEVIQACKFANAHEFISKLPHGYDTLVGEKGALLSGGQKQRIAIARALIKNPPILLLDEATSALDTDTEHLVQAAIDRLSSQRTTIVIAHRLSTIKNADRIVVINRGVIDEVGKHDELIEKGGTYAKLVQNQELKMTKKAGYKKKNDKDDDFNVPEEDRNVQIPKKTIRKAGDEKKEKEQREQARLDALSKRSLPMRRLLNMNAPEKWLIFFGCIGSIIDGAIMPTLSLVFTGMVNVFSQIYE